ncbi:hypothetical protein, partial [Xanthomonas graminis]|uniref:hypothetical protein n=1 Tax=Xanthomonas graminis TaxID=3390026 RepID=UPI0019553F33
MLHAQHRLHVRRWANDARMSPLRSERARRMAPRVGPMTLGRGSPAYSARLQGRARARVADACLRLSLSVSLCPFVSVFHVLRRDRRCR